MEVQSQFIEMFNFHELNLNAPSNDFQMECYDDTSSCAKIPASDYLKTGKYAVYDQSQDNLVAGYTNEAKGLCEDFPAVLFGDHSRVIKYINEPFYIGADGVKIIRPKSDNLLPEFLYYDLKYHCIPNTGYNRHFKYIKMIELTKASLEQQKRFLSIAHQADKSKFVGFKSQFIEMFGDLTQDTPWSKVVTITNGKAYPEEYQDKGLYPICGSGGIMYYGKKKLCNGNTTILGRKGNINSPIFMESGYWIVDTAFSLDVDKEKLHPKFFYYWCCQYDFTKLNKQGVLPSLTRKDLEKVEMAIPPMGMQKQFVSIAQQADKSKLTGHCLICVLNKGISKLIN